jgi:hypothetical protein
MRDKYYGDNRDLVKWGVLLTLAERYSVKQILQVLYYRPTNWAHLDVDGDEVALPAAVARHFRRAAGIAAIETAAPVEVFADEFVDRHEYHRTLLDRIRSRPESPGIVFLDPDTGLEPRSPSHDHVLDYELATLWAELRNGDVLVVYQHQTNQAGRPWIPDKKQQFERAIGLPPGSAKLARSERIARDVAFFYSQKACQTT